MGTVPQVTGDRVIRALAKAGWEAFPGGKHTVLRHMAADGVITGRIPVPTHGTTPLKRRTLLNILSAAGLTVDEFKKLL
ncbi:MAG: type II toxin-antitoxin system HicA family toxin [Chloroflexi bacterium]|nr:type II toxin-antitoxin system HicA family toxin [Chloroflexota bacterium]